MTAYQPESRATRRPASPRAHRSGSQVTCATLIATACFAATIPLGSVARWASAGIVLACAALAFTAWLLGATTRARTTGTPWSRTERGILLALLAWALLQIVPLPRAWLLLLHPLATDPFAAILGDATRAPLAVNPFATVSALTLWLAYALLTRTAREVFCSRTAARRFAALLAAAGTAQACCGLFGFRASADATLAADGIRLTGTFSSGNAFGGFLVLTLLTTAGLLLHFAHDAAPRSKPHAWRTWLSLTPARGLPALLLVTALAIQGVALLLSGSRGATLAGVAGLGALTVGFLNSRNRPGRARTATAAALLMGVVAVIAVSGTFAQIAFRFTSAWDAPQHAADPRLTIWSTALHLLASHPLGVGLAGFEDAYLAFQPAGFQFARVFHAHNDWLQFLIELGLPGGLLLLTVLVIITRRLLPLFRAHPQSDNPWLSRAWATAWFATLAHALVEFNLSARPGVALTAFAILGAALASADRLHSRATAPAHNPQPPSTPAHRAARLVLAMLMLILVSREVRCAVASRLAETGAVALGHAPNPYAWLRAPPLESAAAEARLKEAVAWTPRHGRTRYIAARARLDAFRQRRAEALTDALARNLPLSPATLRRSLATAMRAEEVALCRELEPELITAVRLAPWDADSRALLGDVLLRSGTAFGITGTQTVARALAELDQAVALAPNDLTVLAQVCQTLGETLDAHPLASTRPDCQSRLWNWGRRTLEITGANVDDCLANWSLGGIAPERVPLSSGMPSPVLRAIANYFDRAANGPMTLRALDRLAHQLTNPTPSHRQLPSWHSYSQEREWIYCVRDQARWNLRLGCWAAYRALAPDRHAAFAAVLAQETAPFDAPDVSPVFARIGLENLLPTHGLNRTQRLRLCRLRFDNGDADAATRLLAETTLATEIDALPDLRTWLADTPPLPANNYARRLIEARLLLADHQPAPAVALLAALAADPTLPSTINRAIRPWHAEALLASGQHEPALALLTAAATESPTDARILATLIRASGPAAPVPLPDGPQKADALLDAITPPIPLDVHYQGGALILRGLSLPSPTPPPPGQPNELRLYWTLHHPVDANLAVRVRLLDRQGREKLAHRIAFEQAAPRRFGGGNPRLGETIVMRVPLSAESPAYARLSILVTRGPTPTTLNTDERLPAVEVDQ